MPQKKGSQEVGKGSGSSKARSGSGQFKVTRSDLPHATAPERRPGAGRKRSSDKNTDHKLLGRQSPRPQLEAVLGLLTSQVTVSTAISPSAHPARTPTKTRLRSGQVREKTRQTVDPGPVDRVAVLTEALRRVSRPALYRLASSHLNRSYSRFKTHRYLLLTRKGPITNYLGWRKMRPRKRSARPSGS